MSEPNKKNYKTSPSSSKRARKSRVKQHGKTSPVLFMPALIVLIAAVVFGSMGSNRQTAGAMEIQGVSSNESMVKNGLVIDLDFRKNNGSFIDSEKQNITNLVNNKEIGYLGDTNEQDEHDPSYDQNGFFTFDGNKQYIRLDGNYAPKADFTYELWLRAADIDKSMFAISSQENDPEKNAAGVRTKDKYWWFMGFNNGNMVYIPYPDKSVDDSWHHVAVTRNDDTLAIYVDGQPAEVTRNINKYILVNDKITIGALNQNGEFKDFFKGDIAQLRIYAKALTNDEILTNIKYTRPDFLKAGN